jgi:hypothetical protein
MKTSKLGKSVVGMAFIFTSVATAPAALVAFVDMDTVTPGIQSSISVAPGAMFSVDLWLTVDAGGLSSFSISAIFDTSELSLMPPGGGATTQPLMPGGLLPLAAPMEVNPLGHVFSINGATFGAGPASVSFPFATISFVAPTPITDVLADLSLGYFNLPGAIDDAFDSGGTSIAATTTFSGGTVNVVPEPTSAACLLALAAGAFVSRRRRR